MKTDKAKVFECKRCGFCCQGESTVSLSPEEQEQIASYLGLKLEEFLEKYTVKRGRRVEMKTVAGHCIFYQEKESLCLIHPVKPFHCKQWPLHPSILKDRESFEIIRRTCPGFSPEASWEDVKKLLPSSPKPSNSGQK
ncbi:MAG TPA: YkgJ family cysteine cluster protein [Thermodesulfatator atlanticus]|uniref:YkgJ family cysteine cluster protein n=1 Tax=Thermodesulfatator atlanticus TaxID=501497 RepID=A0A7V5U3D8_9BACT|nr:YkgJ family cysteine cluster protein [Thermodesulfatator atlanticus]